MGPRGASGAAPFAIKQPSAVAPLPPGLHRLFCGNLRNECMEEAPWPRLDWFGPFRTTAPDSDPVGCDQNLRMRGVMVVLGVERPCIMGWIRATPLQEFLHGEDPQMNTDARANYDSHLQNSADHFRLLSHSSGSPHQLDLSRPQPHPISPPVRALTVAQPAAMLAPDPWLKRQPPF